jgi:hypothetical protein
MTTTSAALALAHAELRAAITSLRLASADLEPAVVARYRWALDDVTEMLDTELLCALCDEQPVEYEHRMSVVCGACHAAWPECERCHRDTPVAEMVDGLCATCAGPDVDAATERDA